ncbi:hypothetical protein HanIR_Chr11g0507381 [Helianthus annuus]|nr:hypothetical protein HanIR_Chr11g0507381 [Helianthus annuus]
MPIGSISQLCGNDATCHGLTPPPQRAGGLILVYYLSYKSSGCYTIDGQTMVHADPKAL